MHICTYAHKNNYQEESLTNFETRVYMWKKVFENKYMYERKTLNLIFHL